MSEEDLSVTWSDAGLVADVRTAISKKPEDVAKAELAALRSEDRLTPDLVFRDPYILDFLGLKEKRTALISRTVTRGLPAGTAVKYPQIAQIYAEEIQKSQDLRPSAKSADPLPENPPLKPSGIPWLGDIPEHWEVKRLKTEATRWGFFLCPVVPSTATQPRWGYPYRNAVPSQSEGLRVSRYPGIGIGHGNEPGPQPQTPFINPNGVVSGRTARIGDQRP
jgi:hypothetical protein